MQTSRKKRPLNRDIPYLKDTTLFIIATEGAKTEDQYFTIFRNPKIQVEVITAIDNRSAPDYVLGRLDNFYEKYELDVNDELWLMIDVDNWKNRNLANVCQQCLQKGYRLAISNPCFELWLLLHHIIPDYNEATCKQIKRALKDCLGSYNGSRLDLGKYKDHVNNAIQNAKLLDVNSEDRWPQSLGTHVYRVVERIL